MITAIIIALLTCLAFICNILIKPSVIIKGKSYGIYWIFPLVGAVSLLFAKVITPEQLFEGLTADSDINPLKILALFLSLTLMSVLLDSAGFFRMLAAKTLSFAKHSQWALFICLYLTVSLLTVFTSNDIIVLTFTPFICYFAHNAKIDPIPYLVGEFIAANTWSMALVIGNPTNIYLAGTAGINFGEYLSVMALPTLFTGVTAFGVLCLIFRKKLSLPMTADKNEKPESDIPLMIIGGIHLGACILLMAVSSLLSIPMWIVSVICSFSQYLCSFIYCVFTKKLMYILESLRRAPIITVPFVLSMFTIVLSLVNTGATQAVSKYLLEGQSILKCGIASFLASNLINNIPMSVLFSALVGEDKAAVYASVVGSNLGAFLTPVGALAGIMWTGLLKNHGVKLSFAKFSLYGILVSVPALAAAIFGLYIMM
ncbi:MAG: hypothetical protein E7674_02750 [Ruminococcaceae bacterium]|nr:hypothetical protein [Oscillospiraceae bacterium]